MKNFSRRFLCILAVVCIMLVEITLQMPQKAAASKTDIYQVNGKFSISTSKLVTECELVTEEDELEKKTRVYKITKKTKIKKCIDDETIVTLKGKKRKKAIKKLNRKNEPIQFQAENGKVLYILFNIYV